jgi:hypothetical protein
MAGVMTFRIALVTALGLLAAPAFAANYPIAGKWTYDNQAADKSAATCGARYMEFRGAQRFDTEGGVPQFRNFSVSGSAPTWRIVDEFFTVEIRGRVTYTLHLIDTDHVELRLGDGGKRILLRRCKS